MLGHRTLEEYVSYLNDHPNEVEELINVVTIHVTGFFRDRDAYDALAENIFPGLLEGKYSGGRGAIRVWSAGCSTGEETYSTAITLIHFLKERKIDCKVEIFGTDISEESCRAARSGFYPAEKVSGLPQYLLKRYFDAEGSGYRISRDIRRHVKFKVHDLFSESPFSMLDLVVCRNVLIHFEHAARGDVLAHFHKSLRDEGFLILGKSEAMSGPALGLFKLVEPRSKIYRKRILCVCSREE
jgi:two-component system CheB/CheR fusion protein